MKRKFNLMAIALVLSSSVLFTSCIGSFSLFKKLLSWNQSISDKFINELIFIVISPAYAIAGAADILVLNSIEFWTGDNPVANVEVKTIEGKDGIYTVETSKEGHKITKENSDETVFFHFDSENKTWSIEADGNSTTLLKVIGEDEVVMYLPDGAEMNVNLDVAGVMAFKQAVMQNAFYAAR